jgi:hypothetical protein
MVLFLNHCSSNALCVLKMVIFLAIFQKNKTFSKPWKEIFIVFLKMEKFFVRQKARKQRSKLFSNSASDAKTEINVYVLDFMNQNWLVTLGQYLEDSNQIVLKHFSMHDVRIEVVANIGKVIRILLILSST